MIEIETPHAEIYKEIEQSKVTNIFRRARVDIISMRDRCHRCGQAIPIGKSFFSPHGAERYCSEICREYDNWSTKKTYQVISIEHLLTRAFHYVGEARNGRAGKDTKEK